MAVLEKMLILVTLCTVTVSATTTVEFSGSFLQAGSSVVWKDVYNDKSAVEYTTLAANVCKIISTKLQNKFDYRDCTVTNIAKGFQITPTTTSTIQSTTTSAGKPAETSSTKPVEASTATSTVASVTATSTEVSSTSNTETTSTVSTATSPTSTPISTEAPTSSSNTASSTTSNAETILRARRSLKDTKADAKYHAIITSSVGLGNDDVKTVDLTDAVLAKDGNGYGTDVKTKITGSSAHAVTINTLPILAFIVLNHMYQF